ncbi:MAG: nuclear transport factor 2 family protein [Gemmatimonadaceae bacterium]|jgi:hypothetical protein|nr:nuclear transport factor 2 family protein [Gemmatimonadaceae bacterium]
MYGSRLVIFAAALSLGATHPLPAQAAATTRPAEIHGAAAASDTTPAEAAKVMALVSSIPLAVDLGNYALAETAFAPSVRVDYTSLWGGEPQQTTPAALMDAWRGIVPGFDATRHELSDVRVRLSDTTAVATAHVDGRHWLGARIWRPVGRYVWSLRKVDARWQVTEMTFVLEREFGDRALASEAMARARRAAP